MHRSAWFEFEWEISEGAKEPYIQVSTIENEYGYGKQVISKWPMNGIKPKYLMVASGMNNSSEFTTYIYN